MNSERDHWDALPERRLARPGRVESAAAPVPLGSTIGNAAFTSLVRAASCAPAPISRSALTTQGAGPLDADIADGIRAQAGGGSPLPVPVRREMEQHLGYDLSGVRVHTGGEAATLNTAVQAEAFTTGTDIFFRPGAYSPGTTGGRELLAHELTHVVQQSAGTAGEGGRVSSPSDSSEVEARTVARDIVARSAAVEAENSFSPEDGEE